MALVLGACTVPAGPSWPQFRHDAAGSGTAPGEKQISVDTVANLTLDYTATVGPTGLMPTSAAVVDNQVYTGSGRYGFSGTPPYLAVFDALGANGCSGTPKRCAPLWTAPLPGPMSGTPAVVNGVVYVATLTLALGDPVENAEGGPILAFDAAGSQGCSGSPVVCEPLWTTVGAEQVMSPIVANGFLYGGASGKVVAYDAAGARGCSGVPKQCEPVWSSADMGTFLHIPTIAVAGGNLVARDGGSGNVAAFDALGIANCAGTPAVCSPRWRAIDASENLFASTTVVGETVFVATGGTRVVGYDVKGVNGCSGVPVTCVPIWSQGQGGEKASSTAVSGSTLFAQFEARLGAYDISTVPCVAPDCAIPFLFQTGTTIYGQTTFQAPSVANGVVFTSDLHAYDARGVRNCSLNGGHNVCSSLWHYDVQSVASPAIVGGRLYANAQGTLYVFKLP